MMGKKNAYKVHRGRKKKGGLLSAVILLAVAVVLALVIAVLWQVNGAPMPPAASSSAASSSAPPKESKPAVEPSSEAEPPPEPQKLAFEGAVPQTDPVGGSYFDDAVFVGDSITEGMLIYTGMKNAKILAGRSINLDTVYTGQVIKNEDGTTSTIMDSLAKRPYAKVYVMLGGNEVRDVDKATFLKRYAKVLDDVLKAQPDAICYVQSITPVTVNNRYNMDNHRIDEYNQALMQLAQEKKVNYLDVAACMKDDQGNLPDEASPADGMHFGQTYFDKWFHYLKTHTVDAKGVPGGDAARYPLTGGSESASSSVEESSGTSSSEESKPSQQPTTSQLA